MECQIVLERLKLLVWQAELFHQILLLLGDILAIVGVVVQQIVSDPIGVICDGHLWLFDFSHLLCALRGLFLNPFSPPLFLNLKPLIRISRKLSHHENVPDVVVFS